MMKDAISGKRWEIIKILSKGDRAPTELAKMLRISNPTIHKHLKYLEDEKLIKKEGEKRGKTKPYIQYSLGEGFIYFVEALPREVRKEFLVIDENLKIHLRIWSIPQKEFHYFVEKFWWEIQDDLNDIQAVAIFGSVAKGDAKANSDIDVLILAKRVKKIEKKYGAKMIAKPNAEKGKMVMAQVFTSEDFVRSLKSGSVFVKEAIKEMVIIYDPNKILDGLRG